MNIYAIWDRMLKYYQPAFIAPDDKQVLAALAQTVNAQEKSNAITQAPHHFEIWKLGEITYKEDDRDFKIETTATVVAQLDSLIRGGVRKEPERPNTTVEPATPIRQNQVGGLNRGTNPNNRTPT